MQVQKEGNREVKRNIDHYNLDMIIALGYRVQSEVACDEIEDTSDKDILSYYYRYYIYMQEFPKNMDEIRNMVFGKQKQLIKGGNPNE